MTPTWWDVADVPEAGDVLEMEVCQWRWHRWKRFFPVDRPDEPFAIAVTFEFPITGLKRIAPFFGNGSRLGGAGGPEQLKDVCLVDEVLYARIPAFPASQGMNVLQDIAPDGLQCCLA